MKNKKGFTLAEVLITLSILGVVAAIMIPSTMQKVTDRQTVTAVKRAYSVIDNAIQMAVAVNGFPDSWNWPGDMSQTKYLGDSHNMDFWVKTLSKYLNVEGICTKENDSLYNCKYWYNTGHNGSKYSSYFKNLTNTGNSTGVDPRNMYKIVLKNGMYIYFNNNESLTNPVNYNGLIVDINGAKGPNRVGYDVFQFFYDQHGLKTYINDGWTPQNSCNPTVNSSANGFACVDWIIKHNNLNYKYRDVSAEW